MGILLRGRLLTFMTSPFVPEVCILLKIIPLALVRRRDRMADIATKGFATRVMRRTLRPAIEHGDRRIKLIADGSNVLRLQIRCGFEDFIILIFHEIQ